MAFAAEHQTTVTYTGTASESYTLTVPASLSLSSSEAVSGTVKVTGTWASDRVVKVTAPTSVTLENGGATKSVAVTFEGIEAEGSNTSTNTATQTITVAKVDGTLFGTWTGTISYDIAVEDTPHYP